MATIQRKFVLKQFQADFISSEARYPAMISAWGTGKDLSAIFRCMFQAKSSPGNLGLILRKEYKDLADSTMRDFTSYTGIPVNANGDAVIKTAGEDSVIMFRHIEQLNNLQNLNLGFFWINQAEELDSAEPFFLLQGRLRRAAGQRTGFVTANASGHNWVWSQWINQRLPDYPVWQATTYENADVLPADYVASLKGLPDNIYKRFVLNDHAISQGLVWPDFDPVKHCTLSYDIQSDWKEIISLDHGYDNPTAVLFSAVNYDGQVIIYNEIYERRQFASVHAAKIKILEPYQDNMRRIIDPSCRNKTMQKNGTMYSIIDEYADYGVHFEPGQNDVDAGINRVAEYFKTNRIIIFEDKCPNLIAELKGYKLKVPKPGQVGFKEGPVKDNDHACDALRYLLMSRPQLPIRKIYHNPDPATPCAGDLMRKPFTSAYDQWMR